MFDNKLELASLSLSKRNTSFYYKHNGAHIEERITAQK